MGGWTTASQSQSPKRQNYLDFGDKSQIPEEEEDRVPKGSVLNHKYSVLDDLVGVSIFFRFSSQDGRMAKLVEPCFLPEQMIEYYKLDVLWHFQKHPTFRT